MNDLNNIVDVLEYKQRPKSIACIGETFCGKQPQCPKKFLHILEHAGQLPHKFRPDWLGSFREITFKRRRNLKKIDFCAHLGGRFFRIFIDFSR